MRRKETAKETINCSEFFPAQIDDRKTSTEFVRQLVTIGLSTVLYLRTDLPEKVFNSVDLDGLPLKILNANSTESKGLLRLLINALKGLQHRLVNGANFGKHILLTILIKNSNQKFRPMICGQLLEIPN